VVTGLLGGNFSIATAMFGIKAMTIEGTLTGTLAEARELLDLARARNIAPIPTRNRPLGEAQAALDDLRAGRIVGRTVLTAQSPARNTYPIGNACSLSAMRSRGVQAVRRAAVSGLRLAPAGRPRRRSKAHRMARPLRPWPLERERRPIGTGVKSVDCTALCPGARALRILEREPFSTRHTSHRIIFIAPPAVAVPQL
jgi:hypothetical protein